VEANKRERERKNLHIVQRGDIEKETFEKLQFLKLPIVITRQARTNVFGVLESRGLLLNLDLVQKLLNKLCLA